MVGDNGDGIISFSWRRTAPMAMRKASVMMENGQLTSGIWSTGAKKKMFFSLSKAFC